MYLSVHTIRGGGVICRDKSQLNYTEAKDTICKCLGRNFFYYGREWAYKQVKPRIIAEKYMEDNESIRCGESRELNDYKFYCMNGVPKFCQVISNRNFDERVDFFDMQWNHQEFTGIGLPLKPFSDTGIPKPKCLKKMIEIAELLSKNMPFVRVDLYEINGQVYFGEITLYPSSGFGYFRPQKWERILGDMVILPEIQ